MAARRGTHPLADLPMKVLILAAALSLTAMPGCHKIPDDSRLPHPEVKPAPAPSPKPDAAQGPGSGPF